MSLKEGSYIQYKNEKWKIKRIFQEELSISLGEQKVYDVIPGDLYITKGRGNYHKKIIISPEDIDGATTEETNE